MALIRRIALSGLALSIVLGAAASPALLAPQAGAKDQKTGTVCRKAHSRHHGFRNLTEDQKARVRAIFEAAKKDIRAVKSNNSLSDEAKEAKIRSIRQAAKTKIADYLKSQGVKPGIGTGKVPFSGDQKPFFDRKHREGLARALNLTDEQKAKMQSIRESIAQQIKALRDDKSLSGDVRKAKAHEIMQAQREKVREILTPEQQQKLDNMLSKARSRLQGGNRPVK